MISLISVDITWAKNLPQVEAIVVDLQYFVHVGLCLFNPTFYMPPTLTLTSSALDHLSKHVFFLFVLGLTHRNVEIVSYSFTKFLARLEFRLYSKVQHSGLFLWQGTSPSKQFVHVKQAWKGKVLWECFSCCFHFIIYPVFSFQVFVFIWSKRTWKWKRKISKYNE